MFPVDSDLSTKFSYAVTASTPLHAYKVGDKEKERKKQLAAGGLLEKGGVYKMTKAMTKKKERGRRKGKKNQKKEEQNTRDKRGTQQGLR